eukprot:TRINITY_DN6422_c0_g1_i1.p1 TRINITY_DN6422_c0_g1~~TRINITY_DN6422_c0_g1_i1.p1  ORF type:complete len:457 (+),score=97.70 TRINITY_DN6422_c0_g1_i1:33-1403(+)
MMFRKKKKSSRESKANNPTRLFIPQIFTDSVHFLEEKGTTTEGIFRISASKDEITRVIKTYDHNAKRHFLDKPVVLSKITSDPHVVGGALKQFLRDMPDALLTIELYEPFISAIGIVDYNIRMECVRRVLVHLPKVNHEILSHLLKLLKQIVNNSNITKMTADNLAICFAPTLIRSRDDSFDTFIKDSERTNKLISTLITDYEELFEKKTDPKPPPPTNCANPNLQEFNQSMKKGVQKLAQKFIEKEKTENVIVTEEEIPEEQRRGFDEAFRVSKKKIKTLKLVYNQHTIEAGFQMTPKLSPRRENTNGDKNSNNNDDDENNTTESTTSTNTTTTTSTLPPPLPPKPIKSERPIDPAQEVGQENPAHDDVELTVSELNKVPSPISSPTISLPDKCLSIQQCAEMLLVGDSLALEYYLDTLDVHERARVVDGINALVSSTKILNSEDGTEQRPYDVL